MQRQALTTRQGFAFLSFLRKNETICSYLGLTLEQMRALIANPKWRLPPVPSREVRNEVRYLGDNYLAFRSANSRASEATLKKLKCEWRRGLHVVQVTDQKHLTALIAFIGSQNYDIDGPTEQYLGESLDITDQTPYALVNEEHLIIDIPQDSPMGDFVFHVLTGEPL